MIIHESILLESTYAIVLNAARMLTPVRESGVNRGRFVEAIIRYAGGKPGDKWCAAFVYYVGHRMLNNWWPLPKTLSCDVLLEYARERGVLYQEDTQPQSGWLFLVMASDTDAQHVGFVDAVLPDGWRFSTVEGNSNDRGLRDGDGVVANTRDPKGPTRYAYINWEALP